MRLQSQYSPENHRLEPNGIYQLFQTELIKAFSDIPTFKVQNESLQPQEYIYKIREDEELFFQKFYVPCSADICVSDEQIAKVLSCSGTDTLVVGKYIKDFIDFINLEEDNLLLVIAPIGWGKTVLLRYMWHYLLTKSNLLREKLVPIYVPLDQYKNRLNSENPKEILDVLYQKVLRSRLTKLLSDVAKIDSEEMWQFVESLPMFSVLAQRIADYKVIFADKPEEKRRRILLARSQTRENPDFLFAVLSYLLEKKGKKPIIIFDNVDPLSLQVNEVILSEAVRLSEEFNIKIILSMRTNTFSALKALPEGVMQAHPGLTLWIRNRSIEQYIQHRLNWVREAIKSRKKKVRYPLPKGTSGIIFNKEEKVLDAMMNVLLNQESYRMLDMVSHHNLRKVNSLVLTYFSTGYLDEHKIATQIVEEALTGGGARDSFESPLWVLVSAVITNNYETFFPSVALRCHAGNLINLFDNGKYAFCRHRIRIYILNYIRRHIHADIDKPLTAPVKREALLADFLKLKQGEDNADILDSVNYALQRLLECDLVESPEYYGVVRRKAIERINSISITDTGLYFLNEFRNYFEYIMFMKDDTYLINNDYGIQDCIV
ncbi:MAG: hypothetical protein GXO35_05330, partial [Gammaproteobacteria bacterium]|nr:hypothetical protein [Gammaproteobacteria bacterium]